MILECPVERLDRVMLLAEEFFKTSKFLRNFSREVATRNWTLFIQQGWGVVFILEEEGRVVGFLGALKFPDISTGEMKAQEIGWFVTKECRGKGLHLLLAYLDWARKNRCKAVSVAYLADSMPDKVKSIYERLGFELTENVYSKEI